MNESLKQQSYINLETFRKSGASERTPVWFVLEGDVIYVRTIANSGKVKRIRNNPRVNIAPCKVDGALLGDWIPAQAREVTDSDIARKVDQLLGKKYGLMKTLLAVGSRLQRREYTILEIRLLA